MAIQFPFKGRKHHKFILHHEGRRRVSISEEEELATFLEKNMKAKLFVKV